MAKDKHAALPGVDSPAWTAPARLSVINTRTVPRRCPGRKQIPHPGAVRDGACAQWAHPHPTPPHRGLELVWGGGRWAPCTIYTDLQFSQVPSTDGPDSWVTQRPEDLVDGALVIGSERQPPVPLRSWSRGWASLPASPASTASPGSTDPEVCPRLPAPASLRLPECHRPWGSILCSSNIPSTRGFPFSGSKH